MYFKYFNNRNLWKAVLMKMVINAKSEEKRTQNLRAMQSRFWGCPQKRLFCEIAVIFAL